MNQPLSVTPYVAVVEDDESLGRSLARLLTASGYHPVTYLSAEAFLADRNRPVFDCLVLDIQLGGISGIELSERLAASGSTTPFLYLTAQAEAAAIQRATNAQGAVVVRKSEPCEVLLAAIDTAVRAHSVREAPRP